MTACRDPVPFHVPVCVAAGALLLLVAEAACSAEWTIEPQLSLSGDYDSNRLLREEGGSSLGLLLAGEARLRGATETASLEIAPRADLRRFPDDPPLDSENWGVRAVANFERELVDWNLELERSDDTTLVTEPTDTGILDASARRGRWFAAAGSTLATSERSAVFGRVGWEDVEYDDADLALGFQDYRYASASLGAVFVGSPRTTWTAFAMLGELTIDGLPGSTRDVSLQLGVEHQLSPLARLDLTVGPQRTESDDGSSNGYVGRLELSHEDPRIRLRGRLSREVLPSGTGVLLTRNELRGSAWRALTPRVAGSLTAVGQYSVESLQQRDDLERYYASLLGALDWRVSREWFLTLTTGYRWQEQVQRSLTESGWQLALALRWNPGRLPFTS